MREMINENQLEEITGGAVTLSKQMNMCGFTTLGKIFKIKAEFNLLRDRLNVLYDEYGHMSDQDFDTLVMNDFKEKGWI